MTESRGMKEEVRSKLQGIDTQVVSDEETDRIGRNLFALRMAPPSRFRQAGIAVSRRLPGGTGSFERRAAFVANMSRYYHEAVGFLREYGHLYAEGKFDDFFATRRRHMLPYYSELAPYLGSPLKANARRIVKSVTAGAFEIAAPLAIQVMASVLEPLGEGFSAMERKEFKLKSDRVAEFLFGNPARNAPNTAERRLIKLRSIATAAAELNDAFVQQHAVLAHQTEREAVLSRWLRRAQQRAYYSLPDEKKEVAIQKVEEALQPWVSSASIEKRGYRQEDVSWYDDERRLVRLNLAVRFRKTSDKEGGEQNYLLIRRRIPRGSLRMRVRGWFQKGWMGTQSKFFSSEIDIPLGLKAGEKLPAEKMEDLKGLFFLLGIQKNPAEMSLDRESLETLFQEHGYRPQTEYQRDRTVYDIGGRHQVYVDANIRYRRVGASRFGDFGNTLRLQGIEGKTPKVVKRLRRVISALKLRPQNESPFTRATFRL